MCCNIYAPLNSDYIIGNIANESIFDLYTKLSNIRKKLFLFSKDKPAVCTVCKDEMSATIDSKDIRRELLKKIANEIQQR